MDRTTLNFFAIGIIIVFLFFVASSVFLNTPKTIQSGNNDQGQNNGGVQVVNLSAKGINYIPNNITVKANQPVKIVANLSTLQGCLKSLTIPKLGVKKVFSDSDNTLEFTPTQKGTFDFSCFMGMGRGTITVV